MAGPQAVRRTELQETSDARVRHTRERLMTAYRALVSADTGDVSALAVCRAAGVARSTFYTHYETIEDLAVASIADAFAVTSSLDVQRRMLRAASSREITRAGLTRMIAILEEQRAMVLATKRLASRAAILERLVTEVSRAVRAAIRAEDPALGEPAFTTLTDFVAAGVVHASLGWLERDDRDPRAIVEQLMELLPAVLTTEAADRES